MTSKHDKLYSKSPSVKKDENGKPGVHKPSKADGESMGTEGNPLPGGGDGMPVQAHQHEMNDRHHKEMKSMHERHASEQHDMHKRHEDEHKKSGPAMIDKVEKDKKE
jgi:hypothetical protein